jgi:hypothetical protein
VSRAASTARPHTSTCARTGRPAIFAPAGEGRQENQGFDAFLPADRLGDLAVRLDRTALRLGGALHLQGVDEREAISYTRDYFGLRTFESHAF